MAYLTKAQCNARGANLLRWCLCRCTNAKQPNTQRGQFGTFGVTTSRTWKGLCKLIELDGTWLIKYAVEIRPFPR